MCGECAGGSMKKHGPPPCEMNNVGSFLMAFTEKFVVGLEPSRATCARQLRIPCAGGDAESWGVTPNRDNLRAFNPDLIGGKNYYGYFALVLEPSRAMTSAGA